MFKKNNVKILAIVALSVMTLFFVLRLGTMMRMQQKLKNSLAQPRELNISALSTKRSFKEFKRDLNRKDSSKEEYKQTEKVFQKIEEGLKSDSKASENRGVHWESDENEQTEFKAKPASTQRISQGSPVKLKLEQNALIDGIFLKKGSILLGTALLRNKRCYIFITAAQVQDGGINKRVNLKVYDIDFVEGLYCEDLKDDLYQETELSIIDSVLAKVSFQAVARLGKRLYKKYRKGQKFLLRRGREMYLVKETKDP